MVSATPILEPGYVCDPADIVLDADFRDLSPRLSAAEQALTVPAQVLHLFSRHLA